MSASKEWTTDCKRWRGRVLTGEKGHYCLEWDFLPVDETCPEWPCGCEVENKDEPTAPT